jgi:CRISPR/Cas system-associated exonuclease Cas4 (RecB family)
VRKHWTYSSWSTYAECPRKYRYTYVDHLPQPPNAHADRGTEIHAQLEQCLLQRNTAQFPTDIKGDTDFWEERVAKLIKTGATPEEMWTFDDGWNETEREVWCRMKTDAHNIIRKSIAHVVDYKTGRVYDLKHKQQGEVYALGAFAKFDDVKVVNVEMWYLDQGVEVASYAYNRDDARRLAQIWRGRAETLLADRTFAPTPGNWACRFCPFSAKKGGPCDAG